MKNLMFLFCVFVVLCFSCKKKTASTDKVFIDTFVSIAYSSLSTGGNTDLLDPANPNAIKSEDIDIFYLENGVKRRVYNANYDLPENFKIIKPENGSKYYLSVVANPTLDKTGISTTYIQVDKYNFTDTLTTTISTHGSVTQIGEVWYNGVFKADGKGSAPMFSIAK